MATRQLDPVSSETPVSSAPPNLYQKLVAITREVSAIRPTGKTAQGQVTISISDVEEALRPLFAKHGVVAGYSWNGPPTVVEEYTTERGGRIKTYQVDLTVWLVNETDPADRREDRTIDFGSSPSGAVSFALKRYYKALFHLADEDEEDKKGAGRPAPPPRGAQPKGGPRPPVAPPAVDRQTGEVLTEPASQARTMATDEQGKAIRRLWTEKHLLSKDAWYLWVRHYYGAPGMSALTPEEAQDIIATLEKTPTTELAGSIQAISEEAARIVGRPE